MGRVPRPARPSAEDGLARAASGGLARRLPLPNAAGMPPGLHFWPPSVVSASSLSSVLASAPVVGVSGSRAPAPASASVCRWALRQLAPGASVVTGCARGIDGVARLARPSASVLQASAFGTGRGALAARSVAVVRAVASGGPSALWLAFPSGPCPAWPRPVAPAVGVLLGPRLRHLGLARAGGRARRARARVRAVARGRSAHQWAGGLAPRARPGVRRSARGLAPVPAVGRPAVALRLTRRCGL